ncbi:HFL232Cp [Eremothecium sinecaudum]|uniref:HFL232Cp n=1 Tax=Eremothecium sinecaudum TaxID=45286 RepID=A0A0X8HUF8_9SACH|nr:HFL232Cp [Eremothecium sinecaudum]AMD21624.1 HFL232Cp [Eremothecium sinecaudum]
MTVLKNEAGSYENMSPFITPAPLEELSTNQKEQHLSHSRPAKNSPDKHQKVVKASTIITKEQKNIALTKILLKQANVNPIVSKHELSEEESITVESAPKPPLVQTPTRQQSPTRPNQANSINKPVTVPDTLYIDTPKPAKVKPLEKVRDEPRKDPGPYQNIESLLYEQNNTLFEAENYQEIFTQAEDTEQYCRVASLDFQEWSAMGQEILEEQRELMEKMVANRAKLSHKFQVITRIINDRAQVLMDQGNRFQKKLERIQSLGKEILDMI